MLQGVAVPRDTEYEGKKPAILGQWQREDLCAICLAGHLYLLTFLENLVSLLLFLMLCSAPIGVGEMMVSSAEVEKQGMKGPGVKPIHLFQDGLWYFYFPYFSD